MSDAKLQPSTNPITELKATAHLMAMEDGLYCVYNTPGSAPPDAATGLPGVRITPAPGVGGFSGTVGISGFNAEGWLGGEAGAALVRISGGPAQVLVTVYQSADGAHEAPKLQVIRLSDQPQAADATEAVAAPAEAPPAPAQRPVEVAAHIYGRGDVGGHLGEWMGVPGSKQWIEGFAVAPAGLAPSDLEYQAVLGRGWLSPWAEGGQFCGSRGMSLPILGLRVRLRGAAAEAGSVQVAATFVDGTQVGPVAEGEAVEAPSLSPLEAFHMTLTPRKTAAAALRGAVAAPAATPGRLPAAPAASTARTGRAKSARAVPVPQPAAAPQAPRRGKAPASLAITTPATTTPAPTAAAEPPAPVKPPKAPKRTPATTRRR